jgi:predicted AAA+ superfamily ATPase
VGKTTGIKLLIKKLIDGGVDEKAILYLNLELFRDLREFRECLKKYIEIKKENEIENSFIFLDEVTKLPGWDKIVKGFIDLGVFESDVITVSGSSSLYLLKHADSFPGRKGRGKLVFVMPLNFREFVEVHGINPNKYLTNEDRIYNLFEKYLQQGGFPLSVNGINFYEDFLESIEREIYSIGKSVKLFKQIISILLDIIPSATSFNAIGNKVGVSHHVVSEHLEILEDLFLLKIVYLKENGRINFRREKKIFFRDPYIYKLFSLMANKSIKREVLLEQIVQEHLFRKFGEIYYYKNSYEVDAVSGNLRVEVKAGRAHRRYPKGVIVLEEQDIPRFLIEIFREQEI